jgi:hypothetical protein
VEALAETDGLSQGRLDLSAQGLLVARDFRLPLRPLAQAKV